MIELSVTRYVVEIQDGVTAVENEIEAYVAEVTHDVLTGDVHIDDARDAIDYAIGELQDALHTAVSASAQLQTRALRELRANPECVDVGLE